MRSTLKTCLLGMAVVGLAACGTVALGNFDDAPPYQQARTATPMQKTAPPPAPVQTPAPAPVQQCAPCADCSAWETRALQAEADLATCQEATNRVRDAYRDELKK